MVTLTLVVACRDSADLDVQTPPLPVPAADADEGQDDDEAPDDASESESESESESDSGNESGDESTTGDSPPDMPKAEDAGDGDGDPMQPPPEPPDDELADAVDIVVIARERMMTFTAVDADGNALGHIRVRQDDKRQLWVHSVYLDGFAWVGLHRHTYDIEFHRATLSIPDIKMRAQVFADLLGAKPMDDNTDCGLHLATAVSICAVAASTGITQKGGCPASMHEAACRCLPPYPVEYVCK